jgi:hypothetical protein
MPAVSQKINALNGGVSQQPDSLKLENQVRECINYYSDPTYGLIKRPGLKGVQKLTNAVSGGSWFFINKTDEDKLLVQVSQAGSVKVWDAQSGIQQTVNAQAGSATTYATHTKKEELEVLQINDYIFLLNRNITALASATNSPVEVYFGYILIAAVAYSSDYKVTIDSTTFTYSTPSGSGSTVSVDTVTSNLVSLINANASYTAAAIGQYIKISRTNGADFALAAKGGTTGTSIQAFKHIIDNIDNLPRQFFNNSIVEVLGDSANKGDNYFLKFATSNGGASGAGVWQETIGPNVPLGLNPSTMPHAIIKEADGTYSYRELSEAAANAFVSSTSVTGIPTAVSVTSTGNMRWNIGETFAVYGGTGKNLRLRVLGINATTKAITNVEIVRAGQGYTATNVVTNLNGDSFTITTVATQTISGETWATNYWQERATGDLETNPNPTFVGKRITGISFFRNRLVLLGEENIICSQASKYFDFFASTVITIVDSDPIDLSTGSSKPIELRYANAAPGGLVCFADNAQYTLSANSTALSPATAEVNLISGFNQSIKVSPVDLGNTFALPIENGAATSIIELLLPGDNSKPETAVITRAIPSYIAPSIVEMKATSTATTLVLKSEQQPDTLFVFRWFNDQNQRVLSSWSKWTMPGNILMVDFDQDDMYLVLQGTNSAYLTTMKLLTETPGGAVLFEDKYVDLRIDCYDYFPAKTYVSGTNKTKVFYKDGAEITSATPCLVDITVGQAGDVSYPTLQYNAAAPAGQKYYVEVDGNQTSLNYALGYKITSYVQLPAFYVSSNSVKDTFNIPQVHRASVDSYNSGPFSAILNVPGRNEFRIELPQIVANLYLANGVPMLKNAQNIIPIMAPGTQVDLALEVEAPFPVSFNALTWSGLYNNKGIKQLP